MLRKDALDEREADYYEALYTQSQAQFGDFVQTGTVVNNYAHIFDLLIRLRQACHVPPVLLTAGFSFCPSGWPGQWSRNMCEVPCVQNGPQQLGIRHQSWWRERACHPCQAVDHPYLVVHSAAATAAAAAAADAEDLKSNALASSGMCGLCHDPLEQPVLGSCGHAFCRVC